MDFDRMNEYENVTEARNNADGNIATIPAALTEIKARKEVWGFKQEHLIEKPTGIN